MSVEVKCRVLRRIHHLWVFVCLSSGDVQRTTPVNQNTFDAELGSFQAAGQIINQVYQRIAYEAIRGAARAAIAAMKNHRGYRTRPSTMPTGNGGRTASDHSKELVKTTYDYTRKHLSKISR